MPVSFLPLLLPVIALGALVISAFKGIKFFLATVACVAVVIIGILSIFYIPGIYYFMKASSGVPSDQYRYARWLENHSDAINQWILWPVEPKVLEGYHWIDRAAESGYTPAIYIKGIRLKYGEHVPMPPNWNGAGGNVFPQPDVGQPFIDQALKLGFKPSVAEDSYYWRVYRGQDPNG